MNTFDFLTNFWFRQIDWIWDFPSIFHTIWCFPPSKSKLFCLNILASFHELATQKSWWWSFTNASITTSHITVATLCSKMQWIWSKKCLNKKYLSAVYWPEITTFFKCNFVVWVLQIAKKSLRFKSISSWSKTRFIRSLVKETGQNLFLSCAGGNNDNKTLCHLKGLSLIFDHCCQCVPIPNPVLKNWLDNGKFSVTIYAGHTQPSRSKTNDLETMWGSLYFLKVSVQFLVHT